MKSFMTALQICTNPTLTLGFEVLLQIHANPTKSLKIQQNNVPNFQNFCKNYEVVVVVHIRLRNQNYELITAQFCYAPANLRESPTYQNCSSSAKYNSKFQNF